MAKKLQIEICEVENGYIVQPFPLPGLMNAGIRHVAGTVDDLKALIEKLAKEAKARQE